MLSIEVKVNGILVAHIEAHRGKMSEGYTTHTDAVKYDYPFRGIVYPMQPTETPDIVQGVVDEHKFADGILPLCKRILEQAIGGW